MERRLNFCYKEIADTIAQEFKKYEGRALVVALSKDGVEVLCKQLSVQLPDSVVLFAHSGNKTSLASFKSGETGDILVSTGFMCEGNNIQGLAKVFAVGGRWTLPLTPNLVCV